MTRSRLRWQSRLLVAAVIPAAVLLTRLRSAFGRNPAGRRVVAVSLLSGAGAWMAGAATPPAALAGSVLAGAMILGTVPVKAGQSGERSQPLPPVDWTRSPLFPLLTLIVLTLAATRYRRDEKRQPERHGRNAAQITANLGIAALAASFPIGAHAGPRRMAALVAALSEATADTLSSELGEVLGGTPRLITTGRPASAGSDGAVSLVGSLAGLAALPALRADGPQPGNDSTAEPTARRPALAAGVAAAAGLFVDSLLGATAEQRGWLNNDAVNFLSTAVAASLAARAVPPGQQIPAGSRVAQVSI